MATANLALRFILELVGVAAFGYWGFEASGEPVVRLVAGIVAAVAIVVVWALVVAPKAVNPLTQSERDVVGTVILVVAALALVAAGRPAEGLVFAAVVIVNAAVLLAIGPGARDALASAVERRS